MAVRGVVAAFTRNISGDRFSDEQLMTWYDKTHIPDIIATSGIKTALRFQALSPSAKYTWLVVYPTNDINFTKTEEFDRIPKGGEELGGNLIFNLTEADLRFSKRVDVYGAKSEKSGRAPYILAESINMGQDTGDDFNEWYHSEFLPKVAEIPTFRRATRFHVVQSLVEGGPKHFALYEFDTKEIPISRIREARSSAVAEKILNGMTVEEEPYELIFEAGNLDELF